MTMIECARFVTKIEVWRGPTVLTLMEYLVTLPDVPHAEIAPYLEILDKMHRDCIKLAQEFFKGNNAELLFENNYDRWYEANAQFMRYFPQFAKELHERYPDIVPAEMQKRMDFSEVIQPPGEVRN